MKYLFLLVSTIIFIGCARQPLNIYSPQPANTVIVKDDGDAGVNVTYFGNEPKHAAEKKLYSNGVALQARAVIKNRWFAEGNIGFLKELSDGEFYENNSYQNLFKSNAKYINKEIGVGKIFKLNKSGNSNFLFSVGYGNTIYKNDYEIIENTSNKFADFNFTNTHLYFNTLFQFDSDNFIYQVGFKNSYVNFNKITTNNQAYFGDEILILKNDLRNFKSSFQLYQDFGIYPTRDDKRFSIHLGFVFCKRLNVGYPFRSRGLGGNLSVMYSPSGLLKKKK